MQDHLDGCERCRADLASLLDIRSALRGLPAEPMPPDVARRLQHALADRPTTTRPEPAATVLANRRRWWAQRLPVLAAGVVIAGLLGGLGYLVVGNGGTGRSSGSANSATAAGNAASPSTTPAAVVNHTGSHYTESSLAAAASELLTGAGTSGPRAGAAASHATQRTPLTTRRSGSGGASPSAPQRPQSAVPTALAALESPSSVSSCAAHTGHRDDRLLAVDYAYLDGDPRLIMVFPDPGSPQRVVVVAATADCARSANPLFATVMADRGQ